MLFVNTVDTKIKACYAFNAMYVDTVDTKHLYTFLPITFLIFNQFSIRKKFWKAQTEGFSTIPSNTIYVNTVNTVNTDDTRQGSLMHSMLCVTAAGWWASNTRLNFVWPGSDPVGTRAGLLRQPSLLR